MSAEPLPLMERIIRSRDGPDHRSGWGQGSPYIPIAMLVFPLADGEERWEPESTMQESHLCEPIVRGSEWKYELTRWTDIFTHVPTQRPVSASGGAVCFHPFAKCRVE